MPAEENSTQSELNQIKILALKSPQGFPDDISSWLSTDSENGHIVLAEAAQFNKKTINPHEYFGELSERIVDYLAEQNLIIDQIRQTTQQTSRPEIVMGQPNKQHEVDEQLKWQVLKAQLEASGADVTVVAKDLKGGLGKHIWTRDRYINDPNTGVQIYPETSGNTEIENHTWGAQQLIKEEFIKQGTPTKVSEKFVEGGDVLLYRNKNINPDGKSGTVFVGVYKEIFYWKEAPTFTENMEAARNLAKALNMNLVPVPKTGLNNDKDENYYYHLDTFMTVLPDGGVILIPSATTPVVADIIRKTANNDILMLPPETHNLDTNLVTVNGNVFSTHYNKDIEKFLEKRGYHYIVGDFQIMDSGPHCLTNFKGKQPAPDGRSDRVMNENEPVNTPKQTVASNMDQDVGGAQLLNTLDSSALTLQKAPQQSMDLLTYLHSLDLTPQQVAVVQDRVQVVMQNQNVITV